MKVNQDVKFKRVIINSVTTMDINANFHLIVKMLMFKFKVNNKG